ncbi:uncharacterized protein B0T23DRAFT_132759 [Neurospora hispaniola]|uniref:Serine protease n=1 Tax=Neurospora hispaniola TaxID=588809 RepID=A0AAJ0I6T2_9PEZI|nr:hypothetical protein B0T23DRAFT_132759 [Neurospora hispaniola]
MSNIDFVQALKTSKAPGASWRLPDVKGLASKPESGLLEDGCHTEESVFDPDNREKVHPRDFADGGKYRSIIKLAMRYEGMGAGDNRWAIGTGYLVASDTFVTAGHCVFHRGDDGHGLGRLTHMKCFIGYHGKDSASDPSVQFRSAAKVVTTSKYIIDGDRRRDVAFVKVDQPFDGNLNLFKYQDTPLKDSTLLGVIGYPGDKSMNNEKGAEMYELVEQVAFDLNVSQRNMLEYPISTAGGQSGAPVLKFKFSGSRVVPDAVIGTHCYGGSGNNSASVIGGQYGNDYKALLAGLPKNGSPLVTDISQGILGVKPVDQVDLDEAEGFLDVLKDIGRVVAPIAQQGLSFASPFLGPLGGPVSAIGGIALGALSKVCEESALDEDQAPSYKLEDGIAQRAVLAEAALQTVLRMERSPANKRIMDNMQAKYKGSRFDSEKANKLGTKLVPLLSQAGLHLAINENLATGRKQVSGVKKVPKPTGPEADGLEAGDPQIAGFINAVTQTEVKQYTSVGKIDDAESEFFDNLSAFIGKAFRASKPALIDGARAVLTTGQKQLDDYLSKKSASPETDLSAPPNPTDKNRPITDAKAAGLLAHRAVLAECALQAVLEAKNGDLQESVILGDSGSAEPESFFDGLLKTVQMMGSAVVKVAPKVLDVALPILLDTVKGHARAESIFDTPVVPPPAPRPNGVKAASGGFASMNTASANGGDGEGGGRDKLLFIQGHFVPNV